MNPLPTHGANQHHPLKVAWSLPYISRSIIPACKDCRPTPTVLNGRQWWRQAQQAQDGPELLLGPTHRTFFRQAVSDLHLARRADCKRRSAKT